jgi:hypothetical protein
VQPRSPQITQTLQTWEREIRILTPTPALLVER